MTCIGLGPVTNLALAVLLDPTLPQRLHHVVWMGGTAAHHGNVSPVAEADAFHDPEDLALVIGQDWEFTQVGLDVTDDTLVRRTRRDPGLDVASGPTGRRRSAGLSISEPVQRLGSSR